MKLLKIGSSPSCDIVINSSFVSAYHAEIIVLDNGDLVIEDKNSTNGTFVGNKKLAPNTETPIRRGDYIRFGNEDLVWAKVPVAENNNNYKAIINIGSNYRNDIVLNSGVVSRFHATLKVDKKGNAYIVDNGSKNGTQVNGQKIIANRPYKITQNDNVLCGDSDVTEQLKQFIPAKTNWIKWTVGVAASILLLVGAWGIIEYMGKGVGIKPQDFKPATVYVYSGYHYVGEIKDNPIQVPIKITSKLFVNQATAFFVDRNGVLCTNRHVVLPWKDEYQSEHLISELKDELEEIRQAMFPVDVVDSHEDLIRLMSTKEGEALVSAAEGNISKLNAMLRRIKNSEMTLSGELDFIKIGYPSRFYSEEAEFDICNVICESNDKNKDVAFIQLNTKVTPKDIKYVLDLNNCVLEKPKVLQEKFTSIGYPGGMLRSMDKISKSLEPNISETMCCKEPNRYEFEIQYSTIGGHSGAPIINKKGQLVGVLFARFSGDGATTKVLQAKYIKELYDKEVL